MPGDMDAVLAALVEQQVEAVHGAGTQSSSIPSYILHPPGDAPGILTLEYFTSRIRHGNWTGDGFGSGRYSPNIDLSYDARGTLAQQIIDYVQGPGASPDDLSGSHRLDPDVPYLDELDRVARIHDLLYEQAHLALAERMRDFAIANPQATREQYDDERAIWEAERGAAVLTADEYFLFKTETLLTDDPIGIAVQELGRIAIGLQADVRTAQNGGFIDQEDLLVGIGQKLGSHLGALVGSDNQLVTVSVNAVGGAVGAKVGTFIHNVLDGSLLTKGGTGNISLFDALADTFDIDIAAVGHTAVAELTGLLIAEAAEDLGLGQFGTFVLSEATTSVTTFLYDSIVGQATQGDQLISILRGGVSFTNVTSYLSNIAISFVQTAISHEILEFVQSIVTVDSEMEGYFATVGSIIGSVIGKGFPALGPLLGESVGHILGSFVFEALNFITDGWLEDLFEPEPSDPSICSSTRPASGWSSCAKNSMPTATTGSRTSSTRPARSTPPTCPSSTASSRASAAASISAAIIPTSASMTTI